MIGKTSGYWLKDDDFVSTAELGARKLGLLGFPRDWPAVYSQNKVLKSLVGKKGSCAGKKVAVVAGPSEEDREHVHGLPFEPLKSFANAERACKDGRTGMSIIRGFLVLEHLDKPPGAAFVAERYWWNALPDGKWVDFTPRPEAWPELVLAEAAAGAPKTRSLLTQGDAELAALLLRQRFNISIDLSSATGSKATASKAAPKSKAVAKPAASPVKVSADQGAAPLSYSKWDRIVDSDDEEDVSSSAVAAEIARRQQEPVGVRDLAETPIGKRKPLPVPDYLVGNTGGGGGTNCFTSICRLLDLDGDASAANCSSNAHQLCQAFSKIYHSGLMDWKRQRFYERALNAVPKDAFIVVCGLGSILPFLRVARRGKTAGIMIDACKKLCTLGMDIAKANNLSLPCHHLPSGMDKEDEVVKVIRPLIPKGVQKVVILTEQFAHDMLSCGVVANMFAVHKAVLSCAPGAKVNHIPKTVELTATPLEVRSDRLIGVDIRAFNMVRHTTSNDKADFWWWPVRLDNQEEVKVATLGPHQTLCGFDFDRAPEIAFDEVRRTIKLSIEKRGKCNAAGLWWTMRFGEERYSTEPLFVARERGDPEDEEGKDKAYRPEWKQAVHYLSGETSVFPGDVLDLLVSMTPRFTVRAMQQSPFSVEAPPWVKAPTQQKFSATLPVLPYHFLMYTDMERLKVYHGAIVGAVAAKKKELGRRPRVLDVGCGIGLLGILAALEGAEVWSCEAMPMMRRVAREVIGANAQAIADKRGMLNFLPEMMSTRIQIGPDGDVAEKFDIVLSEVMDLWCLGEGVVPTMRHAHAKLLAKDGIMIPSRLVIFAQPLELGVYNEPEKKHKVNLSPMYSAFKSKYSPLRIAQMSHRMLTDEPMPVLEIDLANVPEQPSEGTPNLENLNLCIRMGGKPALHAKLSSTTIDQSGMFSAYGVWWAADLGYGNVCSTEPTNPQKSWKQLVRWLDEPRFVNEGEELQVLACHNENQVNIDDIFMPTEMVSDYRAQLQAEAEQGGEAQPKNAVAAVQAKLHGTKAKGSKAASPKPSPKDSPRHSDDGVIEVD